MGRENLIKFAQGLWSRIGQAAINAGMKITPQAAPANAGFLRRLLSNVKRMPGTALQNIGKDLTELNNPANFYTHRELAQKTLHDAAGPYGHSGLFPAPKTPPTGISGWMAHPFRDAYHNLTNPDVSLGKRLLHSPLDLGNILLSPQAFLGVAGTGAAVDMAKSFMPRPKEFDAHDEIKKQLIYKHMKQHPELFQQLPQN